ncbi:hypothetical protein DFH07DRAFT_851127 [Mycena maculata]|uniref:Zinc finger PHD-type domain-containing protein n=1 Tax=Mycena maculata TaxID=230809 RepID=A0AAD7MQL3_9AGAR|nr:hypothetical protein DFH07DRAFT_851127 [Mycena maculata]
MSRTHLPADRPAGLAALVGPTTGHYRHPAVARQPHPEPGVYHYPPQPPGYQPPDIADAISQRLIQPISQLLASHQAHSDTRLNRLENNIQRLSTEISSARQESRACIVEIANILQNSHALQTGRLKRLENILGMGAEMKEEKTLLNRFDLLSFAVEDLLERVKDPEANLPDGPLHHDMATSPIKRAYANAAIPPKTPSPRPQSTSTAVGTSPEIGFNFPSFSTLVDESTRNKAVDSPQENDDLSVSRDILKTTFAAASPVTRPLVPVDWQNQTPAQEESFAFNPDQSPDGMEPYSALPNQPRPPDGTVASLRFVTAPFMSTPRRSTSMHPVSPALSVSPPQSPSPRQITPSPFDPPAEDHEIPSPVGRSRCTTPDGPRTPAPARESSVGANVLHFTGAAPESPSPSPSRFRSDELDHPRSPSVDTVREELAVVDMMAVAQSDTLSTIASPIPLAAAVPVRTVPSSVTPSPLFGSQMQRTSPPHLSLSIPATPPCPTSTSPNPADLSDTWMSPMSPLSPTTPSTPRRLSPTPLLKLEDAGSIPIPTPLRRPTTSGLRLVAAVPQVDEQADVVVVEQAEAYFPRIKKRKAKARESEGSSTQEPPAKRTRQRSEKKDRLPAGAGKQEKGKKKKKVVEVLWPAMTPEGETDPEFVGKFIGCDNMQCNRWYHYSCLGIVPGDPRLDSDFLCPLCTAGHPAPAPHPDTAKEQCSRPDCVVKDEFFESLGIFGRHHKLDSTYGRLTWWLVFWKGYEWSDATWEPTPPSEEAVKEFIARATAEGLDLDDDGCIMLSEAQVGGARHPDASA